MATFSGEIRQGLPRVPGGAPWPENGVAAKSLPVAETPVVEPAVIDAAPVEQPVAGVEAAETAATVAEQPTQVATGRVAVRRGLPRVAGGEPWPAAASVTVTEALPAKAPQAETAAAEVVPAEAPSDADKQGAANTEARTVSDIPTDGVLVRQGLPRVPGGDAWPAATVAPAWAQPVKKEAAPAAPIESVASIEPAVSVAQATELAEEKPAPEVKPDVAEKPAAQPAAPQPVVKKEKPKRAPVMIGEKTLGAWAKLGALWGAGAVFAAAIIVLAARGVTTLPGVPDFLQKYPGEYAPAFVADPGFPAWARWSHFLNIFLMVLIIRSGILVRTQQQPPAFWTPKKGGKKVSINLWLHTSLDVLWLVNGIIFVLLLFVSGHWARIVPTSWEVFPNAASAMLQYLTLDWPTENGWVNYNALQQLMYFIVVFIAAPLAAITGVRMSEWWPEKADRLNKIYPAPLARAIHFPTMLFFVLFIMVHVFLVFSTGALRNLNHMFAGTDVLNWTGFWLFALAIGLTTAGWFAARPLILAPIANLFGRVSNR